MPSKVSSKSAGKQKIQAGPKGGMAGFLGAGTQVPGGSAVKKGDTSGKFAKGGSGKMHGFSGVSAVKKA
jgi:hypothetical protein